MQYYKIVDADVVKCASQEEGQSMLEDPKQKRIAETHIHEHRVSTMFLVMDHRFGKTEKEPIVFETKIYNYKPLESYETRCSSLEGSYRMHAQGIKKLKSKIRTEKKDLYHSDVKVIMKQFEDGELYDAVGKQVQNYSQALAYAFAQARIGAKQRKEEQL